MCFKLLKKRSVPDGNVACKLSKCYFCKQHFKNNCLGLYNMGTNKNRKGDLNVASSSFFPLKNSVLGHFILHCHWTTVGQLKLQNSSSLLWGVPRKKSQRNLKGGSVCPCDKLGTPSGLCCESEGFSLIGPCSYPEGPADKGNAVAGKSMWETERLQPIPWGQFLQRRFRKAVLDLTWINLGVKNLNNFKFIQMNFDNWRDEQMLLCLAAQICPQRLHEEVWRGREGWLPQDSECGIGNWGWKSCGEEFSCLSLQMS